SASLARGVRGLWSVYVAAPDDEASLMNLSDGVPATIQRRDVRVLQTAGQMTLVSGTVSLGQLVVMEGAQRIGPGVAVSAVLQNTASNSIETKMAGQ
ncbi:MAG: RND transporter, partial [Planctomycetota bacterium]